MPDLLIGPLDRSHVRLSEPEDEGYGIVRFSVEMEGDGIRAQRSVHATRDDLIAFVSTLANEWKGWEGHRHWEGIDHDLSIAAHSPMGHVALRIRLTEGWLNPTWAAEVEVHLEAGEETARLAADLRHFLAAGTTG